MAHVEGARIHRNRLARMRRIKTESLKELYAAGEIVRNDIAKSIRAGAVSGSGHVPSAPGQPPNADTHRLDMSIDVRLNPGRNSVSVVSLAPYSAFLEWGSSNMVERPFMRPGLRRNRNRIVYGQVVAVNRTIRVLKGS